MDEIGSILREARETKGLTLADVHQVLRINPKYIKAMEAGQFTELPSVTHARGYLRKYARYLNLETEPLLERYEYFRGQKPEPPAATVADSPPLVLPPEPEIGTFFNPLNSELDTDPNEGRGDRVGWFIIAALVVFIALLAWRFVPMVMGINQPALSVDGITTAIEEIMGREPTEDTPPLTTESEEEAPGTTTELIVPTGRTTGSGSEQLETADQIPTIAPTRNPLPATIDIIDMQIDITQRAWLRVIVDDINVYEGQALKGDVLTFTGSDYVNIRTGNAFGVVVRINDIDIGRLGEREQVVDQTWETTQ